MDIIILIVLSVVSMLLCSFLTKVTKVPAVIYLMVIGILLGSYVLDIAKFLPHLAIYSALAIVILFLVSGFGLNVEAIKSSGAKTFGLSSIPAIGEGLIVGVITWIILTIIPVFDQPSINFAAVVAIMLIFAMSSPAIIIPFNMAGKGRGINASIFDELTVASVIDNFIPIPIVLVFLNVAYAVEGGSGIAVGSILIQTVLIVIAILITFIVSYFIGKLTAMANSLIKNPMVMATSVTVLTIVIFFVTGPIGASLGIIIGFGIGMGYNVATPPEIRFPVLGASQKLYGLGMMPIVFIYVGTQIQVDQLFKVTTVVAFALATLCGIFCKGFIAKKFLLKRGSSKAEGDYAAYGFAAKGIILINISLVIGTGLTANGLDYILQMMYMLAAISIIISVPYSSVNLGKQLDVLEAEQNAGLGADQK